jgi:hypothetical protein
MVCAFCCFALYKAKQWRMIDILRVEFRNWKNGNRKWATYFQEIQETGFLG